MPAGCTRGDHKITMVHPLDTVDICIKFHDNPSNICLDISARTQKVFMLVVQEKGTNTVLRTHPLETMIVCTKFPDKPVQHYQGISLWWTKVVDLAILWATLRAWLNFSFSNT